jgi:hypothetical protein
LDGTQANLPGPFHPRGQRHLSEIKNPEIAAFGKRAPPELQRLCHMVNAPLTVSECLAVYARLSRIISQNHDRLDDAVKLARPLQSAARGGLTPGISGMNTAWHRHTNPSAADAIKWWYHLRERGLARGGGYYSGESTNRWTVPLSAFGTQPTMLFVFI